MAAEQHGKTVRWGVEALDGIIINSTDASLSRSRVDTDDEVGETVNVTFYNPKVTFTISGKMLETTDEATVKASVSAACEAKATSEPFNLASGGTVVITDLKTKEVNNGVATVDITAEYLPKVTKA